MVINSLTAQPFMVVSSINGVKFTQVLTIKINVKKLIPFAFSTNIYFEKLLIRFVNGLKNYRFYLFGNQPFC